MTTNRTLNSIIPKRFFIHIQALYFFEEMYEPIIKNLEENAAVYILLDYDFRNDPLRLKDLVSRIEDFCLNSSKVVKVFKMEITSKNKFSNLKNIRKIIKYLENIDIFLACDLSVPEIQFLRQELILKGAVPIYLQTAGLSYAFWYQYGGLDNVLGLESPTIKEKIKLLNFWKYPRYLKYIINRFRVISSDYLFRYVFSLIFQGKVYLRTKFCKHHLVVDKEDKMLVIYPPDKDLINKVFNSNSACLVEPPYVSVGNPKDETKLLLAFPGPLSNKDQISSMLDFFEIVRAIINYRKDTEVLVRFHPRDRVDTKEYLLNQLRRDNLSVHFFDVSSECIWTVMKQTEVVISGISNMVPLSRVSSQTRVVIGVLRAGFHGIMGSNQLYQDLPDVSWVTTKADISWKDMKKKKFKNLEAKRESINSALNRIYFTSKVQISKGILKSG